MDSFAHKRTERAVRASWAYERRTNQTQEVWVYSHDGPIKRRNCGYIRARSSQSRRMSFTKSFSSIGKYLGESRVLQWESGSRVGRGQKFELPSTGDPPL
eukprot:2249355-Pyramimonas_sp.AAC.1